MSTRLASSASLGPDLVVAWGPDGRAVTLGRTADTVTIVELAELSPAPPRCS